MGKKIDLNKFYKNQNDTYLGKVNDVLFSVLTANSRLNKESFLITFFLEKLNIIDKIAYKKKISTLEPGCGIGFFSRYLEIFSRKVFAFDNSEAAISMAKDYNSKYEDITHFIGDGVDIGSIAEIHDQAFDLIYFRGFHPLSRNFFGNSEKTLNLLDNYFKILRPGGVIIIQHPEAHENCLRFNDVVKKYRNCYGVYHPHILVICLLIFRYKFNISSFMAKILSLIYWKLENSPLKFVVIQAEI